ncbi:hypothetical protein HPS54_06005 [Prevotella sp. PCHR]|uniref:Virulence-protein E N-terminal domain-containing protein n=1 Tax=Xylanibacter caecicola TaxID=2736294 RepID=A0ABX2B0N8_9BACT|nr:VapE domain-containing protein [Xylanibacter caecicola]NPE25074.1 hypothetical protein [Xylanibacter caecicola]
MKNIVSKFENLRSRVPVVSDFDEVMCMLTGGSLKTATMQYRRTMAEAETAGMRGDAETARMLKDRLSRMKAGMPAFVAWVTLDGGRTESNITGYTGYVMVDLDHLADGTFADALRKVKTDPHTRLAYTTVSGRGIRVICRMKGTVDKANFRDAWTTANEYYARLCGCPFDRQCSNATRMSVVCHDPDALFRPDAQSLEIVIGSPKPVRRKGRPADISAAVEAGRKVLDGEGLCYVPGHHNEYVSRLIYHLNRYGVAESDALDRLLREYADYNSSNGNPLPGMVHSVYANHRDEHGSVKLKGEGSGRNSGTPIVMLEQFITGKYVLRVNVVSGVTEWAHAAKDGSPLGEFRDMDDTFENSLWCEMRREGINTDLMSLATLLRSDFVPTFHPMTGYLDSLPPWDGRTDHIGRLLSLVHCRNVPHKVFDHCARRWLVALVAAAMFDNVVNHEILVLLGRQGTFKSSFMNNILPPCLRKYYSVKTNSHRMDKDDAFALTENFLINFEEIDSMSRTEVNQLKALTTVPYIKDRPAYGRRKVRLPHRASFCATGNNLQFLTDDTGNRRWLVFEVEHIDNPWTANIDHNGVYAQAKALIDGGFKYWFDGDEIDDINRQNREFETPDSARELVVTHYRHPEPYEKCTYLTSTQIAARFAPQLKVSPVAIGRVMRELEYGQVKKHYGRFWEVIEIQVADIGKHVPGDSSSKNDIPF